MTIERKGLEDKWESCCRVNEMGILMILRMLEFTRISELEIQAVVV